MYVKKLTLLEIDDKRFQRDGFMNAHTHLFLLHPLRFLLAGSTLDMSDRQRIALYVHAGH
jgi:hypothetical protein